MEPELAQELLSLPQFKAFLLFAASEADKLNRLDGLDGLPSDEIAIEAKSREKAYKALVTILAPFTNPQTALSTGIDNKQYIT